MPYRLPEKISIGGVDFNIRVSVVCLMTALTPLLLYYHSDFACNCLNKIGLGQFWLSQQLCKGMVGYGLNMTVIFLVLPMITVFLMGHKPSDYGFRIGNWREGLIWLVALCPLIVLVLLYLVPGGPLQHLYQRALHGGLSGETTPFRWTLNLVINGAFLMLGWEFLFRGYCLFGLAKVIGPGPAIFIQMIPFALTHQTKPELETMATLFFGVLWGFVSWRTQSFLYAFLLHLFLYISINMIAVFG